MSLHHILLQGSFPLIDESNFHTLVQSSLIRRKQFYLKLLITIYLILLEQLGHDCLNTNIPILIVLYVSIIINVCECVCVCVNVLTDGPGEACMSKK